MFLSTNIIMDGYKKGIFPMAESAEDPYVFCVSPDKRGIIEIKNFKVPKSLKKFLKKTSYSVLVNNNFEKVISLCAKISKGRTDTWINGQIKENYCKLFSEGHALSIECYDKNTLIGGLYGVKLGSIFFGESMFSVKDNASKVALVYLAAYLKQGGFKLIDIQFLTKHLEQFGAIEVTKSVYMNILGDNLKNTKKFPLKLSKTVLDYFI